MSATHSARRWTFQRVALTGLLLLPGCIGLVHGFRSAPAAEPESRFIVMLKDAEPRLTALLTTGQQPDRETTERIFRQNAKLAQEAFLAEERVVALGAAHNIHPLWIVNALVMTMTPTRAGEVARNPRVQAVYPDFPVWLIDSIRSPAESRGADTLAEDGNGFTYGLKMIQVPELRRRYPQVDGRGVTVGQIDTGIYGKHVEFAGKQIHYKSFVDSSTTPSDENGHGTHISGTIFGRGAGSMAVGVAPGVTKVYVGKSFDRYGSGTGVSLMQAMEWMADPDGDPATNDAPRLVSNSWGGSAAAGEVYRAAVKKWVSLGIFPCFAAGNAGPRDRTVGIPGGYPEALAVGATDRNDKIASFSSRGPSQFDRKQYLKPDVSAPGVDVLSAWLPAGGGKDQDRQYRKLNGTSMATPHVAGVLALMYQVRPDLTVEQARRVLEETTDPLGGQSSKNNVFGTGRVNVMKLIQKLISDAP
jgi:bacillopeptidase F